jgi:hypothetical protein
MKIAPVKTNGEHKPLSRWILATLIILPLLTVGTVRAQEDNDAARAQVSAQDRASIYSLSNFRFHIFPANTKAGKASAAARTLTAMPQSHGSAQTSRTASVPTVPSPGFYPADLSFFGGNVVTTAESHDIYLNCASTCWGNPAGFLIDLGKSKFIHLVDQYVNTTTNNRYTKGKSVSLQETLFTNTIGQNDLLAIVHAAAVQLAATGYDNIFHVFLPQGVDTCFDLTSVCYSPDNPSTFFFCAYHGSVDFSDIGHVLLTVEPYQAVAGCEVAPPNPNSELADSTNSVLSHELFETITDPDPPTGWVANSSLDEQGFEIGDLCQPIGNQNFQFLTPTFLLNGKKYELQLEYSNKFHGCANIP